MVKVVEHLTKALSVVFCRLVLELPCVPPALAGETSPPDPPLGWGQETTGPPCSASVKVMGRTGNGLVFNP